MVKKLHESLSIESIQDYLVKARNGLKAIGDDSSNYKNALADINKAIYSVGNLMDNSIDTSIKSSATIRFTKDISLDENIEYIEDKFPVDYYDIIDEKQYVVRFIFDKNLSEDEELELEQSGFVKSCRWNRE